MHAARHNPMYGNPLLNRDDLKDAVLALYEPLGDLFSEGHGRLNLGMTATHYDQTAAEMEAFARPLWGIVPLLAGGYDFPDTRAYVAGLQHGVDPEHPEYWGAAGEFDQRLVEMASLALALLLAPEQFWEPLEPDGKDHLEAWLLQINERTIPDNNWLFFRVLVNLALKSVGRRWSESMVRQSLQRIDDFYIGGGHYRDGVRHQIDYYSPMALHYYGLVFAKFAGDQFPDHAQRFRERARRFATDFQYWFADDGSAIPFGRSLTYRFAQAAFWSACAYADEEVLPWGHMKGLVLRHLRWWAQQPMCDRSGVLTVGYSYPNLFMSEAYNGPGSPYWALKTMLVLALPDHHPFWQAEEAPADALPHGILESTDSGFMVRKSDVHAIALTGGQDGHEHRCHDAKYGRFAYSTAFPFSVINCDQYLDRPDYCAVDAGITLSRDGITWLSRSRITDSGLKDGLVWGVWQPDQDLNITTWLTFASDGWYMALHKVVSSTPIQISEGGLSIERGDDKNLDEFPADYPALSGLFARSPAFLTGIVDLLGERRAELIRYAPNCNIVYPRSVFPRLVAHLEAGTTWLATAVYGGLTTDSHIPELVPPAPFLSICRKNGIELNLNQ